MMVRAAPMSQQRMSRPGDLTCRATSALTMKMPEPIMEPMTSVVAEVRPRALTKLAGCFSGVIQLMFLSMAGVPALSGFAFALSSLIMDVLAGISVEQYLHSSFPDLDREYRDGALVERSMPDYLHGKTQALLTALFMALRKRLSLYPCAETRMMLRAGRFLIPDVAVFHPHEPGLIPDTPPLIAIEILSPDDRLTEVREKLEEYRTWGVPHVWLVDPRSRRFYKCDPGLTETSSLSVPELGIEITPHDLF